MPTWFLGNSMNPGGCLRSSNPENELVFILDFWSLIRVSMIVWLCTVFESWACASSSVLLADPNWQGHFFLSITALSCICRLCIPVPPFTTSHILFPSFILPTSISCICSCKWHCKQNCKAHYICFSQTASHANTHWNKLMVWFKVSSLWSTINTGPSLETLSDMLL